MRSLCLKPLALLIVLLVSSTTRAQKTNDHNTVAKEIATKINSSNVEQKQLRLAIVTFVPLQSGTVPNTYGEYLTESIIGHLSEHSEKIKLFERKRLDAILKENELSLSGMMKPSEALKIGQLIPVDALFSGTYTKLKSYIEVSGRLIDVASGEILMTYSGRVKLTKNIKTLFPSEQPAANMVNTAAPRETTNIKEVKEESPEVICQRKTDTFRQQLHDLSSQQRVDAVVKLAMETPFNNLCGKLHYYLMQALSRYNLTPAAYKQFLLATLDTIAFPTGDERANAMLSFFAHDKTIDDREWQSGLNTLKKVGDYSLSTYISILFSNLTTPDEDELRARMDLYFDALRRGNVGLPRAVDYNKGFFEAMEGLNKNLNLRLYVYEKFSGDVVAEPERSTNLHLMYLKRMYNDSKDAKTKTMVMGWITKYFNTFENSKSHEQLFDFAYEFDRAVGKEDANEFPMSDLSFLINGCRDKFSAYATQTPYQSQKEDRLNFCVRYGIAVPGAIPTLAEAELVLKGKDLDEQLRVMKLLALMDTRVRPLEKILIDLLKRKSLEDKEKLEEIQSLSINMLGVIKTEDAFAIREMIARLTSFNYRMGQSAQDALVKIGKPAVPGLTERLKSATAQEGGLQYKLVVILGKIGKDAKPSVTIMKSMLEKNLHQDVRYAIEAALQEIE